MSDYPILYNCENYVNSICIPGDVHIQTNSAANFFRRYLLQQAMSVFKWNLPERWNRDYFLYTLYCWGYICIFDTKEYGVIPQQCGFRGRDVFYAPKEVIITNPALKQTYNRTIDEDCVVLKLQSDYGSIMDLVNFYTGKLALMSQDLDVNLINSKMAYTFVAGNKAAAEALKKLYDKVSSGEPAVVFDKSLLKEDGSISWELFSQNLTQNYIVSDLLSDMRKVEEMFDTKIGLPNANTDKRERLITDEVNANNTETMSLGELWLEQLKKGCEEASNMFGIEISVDWRHDPNESNNVNSRDVELPERSV